MRLAQDGVGALREALARQTRDIERAIDLILAVRGRLVVTGVGKSGHVARKLAATFSSTGTPAFFVHPSEASHGDLGMVRPDDAVLMLSWSGNTRELQDLTKFSSGLRIPLISITSNAAGALAKASDVAILLPVVEEACPHNLAPTTSTTLQVTAGDALATAVLRRRDFNPASFHQLHPGGSLGASLTPLGEIAFSGERLPLVSAETPIIDVIGELTSKSLGIVGVCDPAGRLEGVITDGDIRRFFGNSAALPMGAALNETTAGSICTKDFTWFSPNDTAGAAIKTLEERKISAGFLVDDGIPVGCVTMLQLLNKGLVQAP